MIGTIIKNARVKANLSQKELGNLIGLADTTISNYERGNTNPTFEIFVEILKVCNFDIIFVDNNKNKKEEITLEKMKREY